MADEAVTPDSTPVGEKVTLRHPHTGDTKIVDGLPEQLIPLMGSGYQQVKGA